MEMHDLSAFTSIMVAMGERYGRSISAHLVDIYWHALKEFDLQDVQAAFQSHINNPDGGQYFPRPADVVRSIEGSGETKALQAWTKVEKTMTQVGRYQSIVFDDPLIHAAIEEMGGWVKLCAVKNEELPFRANEFQKRYLSFLRKAPLHHLTHLSGIVEVDNAQKGHALASPLLIGDPKMAKQVFENGENERLSIQTLSQFVQQILKKLPSSNDEGEKS